MRRLRARCGLRGPALAHVLLLPAPAQRSADDAIHQGRQHLFDIPPNVDLCRPASAGLDHVSVFYLTCVGAIDGCGPGTCCARPQRTECLSMLWAMLACVRRGRWRNQSQDLPRWASSMRAVWRPRPRPRPRPRLGRACGFALADIARARVAVCGRPDRRRDILLSWETLIDAIIFVPFVVSYFGLPQLAYIYVPYFLRVWTINSKLQMLLLMVARLSKSAAARHARGRRESSAEVCPLTRCCGAAALVQRVRLCADRRGHGRRARAACDGRYDPH